MAAAAATGILSEDTRFEQKTGVVICNSNFHAVFYDSEHAAAVVGVLVGGAQQVGSQRALKPYRVLLVVDKWEDPASQVITSERDSFQHGRGTTQSVVGSFRNTPAGSANPRCLPTVRADRSYALWRLAFHLNGPYCDYFNKHASSWQLWLGGPLRQQLQNAPFVDVSVDEGPASRLRTTEALREPLRIEIPSGAGDHVWKLGPAM